MEKKDYAVKNISLAGQGQKNIAWAESQMGALLAVRARFAEEKPLAGIAIGMALHVTKETAALVQTLRAGGAEVAITGCNPLSTQDDVAAALAKSGVAVYAWKGETHDEYYANLNQVIRYLKGALKRGKKIATIDDGCDLISEIHQKHTELIPHLVIGTEETTTGVIRLNAMEKDRALHYPVVAVNNNKTKHMFDNYYGTGQSTIDGILRATSILLAGKHFVVSGYGYCGQGVAKRAAGMGAIVIVTETDPIQALRARMDGFLVMPMRQAAKIGEIFVTVTGNRDIISTENIKLMKDGAILANSGHFDIEIDTKGLREMAKSVEQTRPGLEKFIIDDRGQSPSSQGTVPINHTPFTSDVSNLRGLSPSGTVPGTKSIYLCGEGRLVNLACAEGHPSIVMSLSFCGQALAVEYGIKNQDKLKPAVHTLPEAIDQQIASLQLKAMGVKIDALSKEQKHYLDSWETGT